jgi:hypothetical protein
MVDSNNGNDDTSKNKDADKVGKLSDGLLRLVEEDDGKGKSAIALNASQQMNCSIRHTPSRKPFPMSKAIAPAMLMTIVQSLASLRRMTIATREAMTISLSLRRM